MATVQQIFRALQAGRNPWLEGQDEITPEDIESEIGEQKPSLGLLGTIGKVLDFPGMTLRSAITALAGKGKWGASGRDVLSALGITKKKEPEGFDWANLGTEVLLDPLNLLGGVNVLTKTGRAAKMLAAGQKTLRAQRDAMGRAKGVWQGLLGGKGAEEAVKHAEEAYNKAIRTYEMSRAGIRGFKEGRTIPTVGTRAEDQAFREILKREGRANPIDILREAKAPPRLAPTWAGQAKAGQRQVLGWDIPFTGIKGKIPLAVGAERGILNALEPVMKGITASRPVSWLTSKFKHRPEALEETAPLYSEAARLERQAAIEGHQLAKSVRERIEEIAAKHGDTPEEVQSKVLWGLQKRGKNDPELLDLLRRGLPPGIKQAPNAFHEEEVKLIDELAGRYEYGLKKAQAAGIPVTGLEDEELAFSHRTLTPEGRRYLEGAGKTGKMSPLMRTISRAYSPEAGFAERRIPEFKGLVEEEINPLIHAQGGPEKMFWENPAVSAGVYHAQLGQKSAQAQLVRGLTKQFSRPAGEGVQGITVKEMLEKAPVSLEGVAEHELSRIVPQPIADEYFRMNERLAQPELTGKVMKTMESIRRWMGAWLLAPFTAYHARNLTSNGIMTWMAGVFNPRNYIRAIQEYRDPVMRKLYEELGVLHGGITREYSTGAAQRWLEEVLYKGKPEGFLQKFKKAETVPGAGKIVKGGFAVGEAIEGVSRIAHYLGARERGMTSLAAVDDVKKWLFNSDELGKFDRALRPMFFFYSWYRKAIPRLVKSFQETPSRMAMLSRVVTQPSVEREALPEWMRTGAAIPMGKGPQGEAQYIGGLGTPLEAFQTIDFTPFVKSGLLGIPIGMLQKAGIQATPPLKGLVELMFNKNLATGEPLSESEKAQPSFLHKLLPGYAERTLPSGKKISRADPHALWLLRNTPFSRVASELGRLSDPNRNLVTALGNVLTGLRTHSVDIEKEKLTQQRKAIEGMLEEAVRQGKAKSFKEWFATGKPEEKDEAVVRWLRLKRAVQKAQAAQ